MLKPLLTGIMTMVMLTATALEYSQLESRAKRAFAHEEWASAGAIYAMMIAEQPQLTDNYGKAIVAAGMLADSAQQITLTNKAFDSLVPIDSLFKAVETTSFAVSQTSLYERYLLYVKSQSPWLSRIIDDYLLRYYTFRRNGNGMIDYSLIMLQGAPNHIPFMYTLAQGYLLTGHTDKALATYKTILELDGEQLEALLYLANYYYEFRRNDDTAAALSLNYFRRAHSISSTPFVAAKISELAN